MAQKVRQNANLGALLGEALSFRASGADLVSRAQTAAEPYGFRAVAAKERTRALETQARLAAYRAQFVDGPVLEFPKTEELRRSFNPSNLVPPGRSRYGLPDGDLCEPLGQTANR